MAQFFENKQEFVNRQQTLNLKPEIIKKLKAQILKKNICKFDKKVYICSQLTANVHFYVRYSFFSRRTCLDFGWC